MIKILEIQCVVDYVRSEGLSMNAIMGAKLNNLDVFTSWERRVLRFRWYEK